MYIYNRSKFTIASTSQELGPPPKRQTENMFLGPRWKSGVFFHAEDVKKPWRSSENSFFCSMKYCISQ